MRQRSTDLKRSRLQISLPAGIAERHLELRRYYPGRTDGEIYQLMLQTAGSPARRALDLVEKVMHNQAAELGDELCTELGMAIAKCRQILAGDEL